MNIRDHPLAWRWTNSKYTLFPDYILAQIEAIETKNATQLLKRSLHLSDSDHLSPRLFDIVRCSNQDFSTESISAWLRAQQPDLSIKVFISWDKDSAIRTTWEIFSAHWDDFCYPSSDDVAIFPDSEMWALLYHHSERFQFGRKRLL